MKNKQNTTKTKQQQQNNKLTNKQTSKQTNKKIKELKINIIKN